VPHSIIVADDDKEICDLIKISLETKGYVVTTVADGRGVLKELKRQIIDLVIVDIQMPELDGYHLIEKMREKEEWKSIPIVVVSALTRDSRRSEELWARDLGVSAFFVKPFNPLTLVNTAEKILSGKEETT